MRNSEPKSKGRYKRPLDLFIVIIVCSLFAPIFLLLWILIPLSIWIEDRGPIFFRQPRVGKQGHVFSVLKFRTMSPDARHLGPAWTLENDPRVTRVGRFLRTSALDELPELISILKGQLSLVGPRALDTEEQHMLEEQIHGFSERLQIRPGLTGLAQIYDQEDSAETKLEYDLQYIHQMSLLLDLKLLSLSFKNTILRRWDNRSGKSQTQS